MKEERKRRKEQKTIRTTIKQEKMEISTYLSKTTLNVNGINATMKRHGVTK